MASTTVELTWVSFLFCYIGFPIAMPPQFLCNDMSALHMSINSVFHKDTKYIELDYYFVHEKVALGTLITLFLSSTLQIVDILTS